LADFVTNWAMATAAEPRLDEARLAELGASFRGELVGPGDSSYDDHRRT
jgi:hypothetical protein